MEKTKDNRLDEKAKIDNKREKMINEPVEKLVCKMAIPTIISMLVSALYNFADTFFVGKIGSSTATGAVGIVFSYMAIIQAVGCFFGHGSGNFISREIGKKNYNAASKMAATGFFSSLFTGVLIGALGLIFKSQLSLLLGSTATMLNDTKAYITFILIATPFMTCSYTLNNQLRLQGNSVFAMIGLASGAVINTIFDPIFIYVLKMGVSGAALSTCVSQIISFIILLIGCQKSSNVTIRWKEFSPSKKAYKEIFVGGFPSLSRQGLASISMLLLNRFAGGYGDAAIAAFTVVTKIMNISTCAILGFGQGFQPVCGFNYGAGRIDRVKKAFWFSVKISTIALTIIAIPLWIFSPQLVQIFRDDSEVIKLGTQILRYQLISMPFLGWVIVSNMFLQNIRKVVPACIVAMARQGIVFLPLLFIMMHLFKLTGIELTQPISDIVTFIISLPFTLSALKEINKPKQKQ